MAMDMGEVTRTLLRGRLAGELHVSGLDEPVPVRHGTDCAGRPMVLVRDGDDLLAALARAGDPAVLLTVVDEPPADDAPSLGRATVAGRLRPVPAAALALAAVEFADANPDPDLLDVGRGLGLHRIEVDAVRLRTSQADHLVPLDDYIAADPDPLHAVEADVLADLADHHAAEMEGYLHATLVAAGVACAQPPRAVRLDRYGFTVHIGGTAPYVRLHFPGPVRDEQELARLLHPVLFHCAVHGAG
ncbi:hypothetical protein GCM10010124_33260 [Pilimelia terevasa]|uniref:DUF2470 domain-containing protein n=1 Tax=Pilimelia terevasa TaxID=53372 RepID=A0A8J3BUA9_9ACTN|nr:DUF2470 domain-containing protein [Pilimelia terevasa]GGK37805.1 hypothetical protein GCM10010124_33260 [Pilimelia terevasa]